jgi:hypothetical protein
MRSVAAALLFVASTVSAQVFDLTGYVAARNVDASGRESWIDGGFGRLEPEGFEGLAHLGVDLLPANWLELHASGTQNGLIEAHATLRREIALDDVQLRAGLFFLPTSKENKDDNWASPYTIGFSTLNAWIGQEVRPLGVDLQYRHTRDSGHVLTGGATAFRGNDTMGTLLAWRGWSAGDRLAAWDETLPLPPLGSLAETGPFWRQRNDGTTPFRADLDGHTGYAARVRYSVPQRGNVQYTFVDNGGDRALYGDEYSWGTRFHLAGAEIGNPDTIVVASEAMRGETTMGLSVPYVAAEFWSAYLLISGKRGRNRWTARYEVFGTEDQDHSAAEINEESGRAWTLSWLFDATRHLRGGIELTQVTGDRAAAGQYGFDPSTTAHSFTLEARWRF